MDSGFAISRTHSAERYVNSRDLAYVLIGRGEAREWAEAAMRRCESLEAEVARLKALADLPAVTEESAECPECGSFVEWDVDPDIGDCVVCDNCAALRFWEMKQCIEHEAGGE